MTARIAAADVDPIAQQKPPIVPHRFRRRTVIFTLVGALAYLIGLIATIPASTLIEENDRLQVGGTIWNGEAVLASSIRVEWSAAPLTSLIKLAYSAQWRMSGEGNDVAGMVTKKGDQFQFENISGQISGSLINAAFPNLPLSCQFTADARIPSLNVGGEGQEGIGTVRTGPMRCSAAALAALPVELPEMTGAFGPTAAGTGGALKTVNGQVHFIEMRLSREGMFSVWPTQAAVGMAPFLAGQRYDTKID